MLRGGAAKAPPGPPEINPAFCTTQALPSMLQRAGWMGGCVREPKTQHLRLTASNKYKTYMYARGAAGRYFELVSGS